MNLKILTQTDKSPAEMSTYCVIPFLENSGQGNSNLESEKQVGGFLGCGAGAWTFWSEKKSSIFLLCVFTFLYFLVAPQVMRDLGSPTRD